MGQKVKKHTTGCENIREYCGTQIQLFDLCYCLSSFF